MHGTKIKANVFSQRGYGYGLSSKINTIVNKIAVSWMIERGMKSAGIIPNRFACLSLYKNNSAGV